MGIADRLFDLTWQCHAGRFDELRSLIEAAGGETRPQNGWLWVRSCTGMTLGVPSGGDPITVFVQIAFALMGPWWTKVPEAQRAMELVNRQWRERVRKQKRRDSRQELQQAA